MDSGMLIVIEKKTRTWSSIWFWTVKFKKENKLTFLVKVLKLAYQCIYKFSENGCVKISYFNNIFIQTFFYWQHETVCGLEGCRELDVVRLPRCRSSVPLFRNIFYWSSSLDRFSSAGINGSTEGKNFGNFPIVKMS